MNTWKVFYHENGKRLLRRFPGDKPTDAVEFAKDCKHRGLLVEGVVSAKKAYSPPRDRQGRGIWCPYCVKFQAFEELAVRYDGIILPATLRCPVCHISINDGYVRLYNPIIFAEYQFIQERKARERIKATAKVKARM